MRKKQGEKRIVVGVITRYVNKEGKMRTRTEWLQDYGTVTEAIKNLEYLEDLYDKN